MRQMAVFLLALLATGGSGSLAVAQTLAVEVPASPSGSASGSTTTDPAQRIAPDLRTISEEEFLAPLLDADSPWVRSLGEDLGTRRADLALARVFEAPVVSAMQEDVEGGSTETEAAVSWRPPRPDRRRLDIERASAELTAARSSFDRALLELRLDLRRVYARWATAAQTVEVLEAESSLLDELARRSEERGRVGEASGLEVRRLRLAELEARARARAARAELTTARAAVAAWRPDLVSAAAASAPRPTLPALPPPPATEPPTHPAVAALEAELRAAELATELAGKVAELPAITLGWKRVEPDGAGPSLDGPVIGLSWPVPLPGRVRAERQRAESRHDALRARLTLMRSRYEAELQGAATSYAELRAAAADAEAALADAEPTVRAARAAFRLGESDLTTLLDAVRTATNARLAALELRSLALEEQRRLERLRGRPFTHLDLTAQPRRFPS